MTWTDHNGSIDGAEPRKRSHDLVSWTVESLRFHPVTVILLQILTCGLFGFFRPKARAEMAPEMDPRLGDRLNGSQKPSEIGTLVLYINIEIHAQIIYIGYTSWISKLFCFSAPRSPPTLEEYLIEDIYRVYHGILVPQFSPSPKSPRQPWGYHQPMMFRLLSCSFKDDETVLVLTENGRVYLLKAPRRGSRLHAEMGMSYESKRLEHQEWMFSDPTEEHVLMIPLVLLLIYSTWSMLKRRVLDMQSQKPSLGLELYKLVLCGLWTNLN